MFLGAIGIKVALLPSGWLIESTVIYLGFNIGRTIVFYFVPVEVTIALDGV